MDEWGEWVFMAAGDPGVNKLIDISSLDKFAPGSPRKSRCDPSLSLESEISAPN